MSLNWRGYIFRNPKLYDIILDAEKSLEVSDYVADSIFAKATNINDILKQLDIIEYVLQDQIDQLSAGGVTSFNSRTGVVTLTSNDVTTALGFTPYNVTGNSSQYIVGDGTYAYFPTHVSSFINDAIYLTNITGKIVEGSNITITGAGTEVSPYIITGGSGSTTFTALTDAPSSYTGQANKIVSVKNDETGLEFTSLGQGVSTTYEGYSTSFFGQNAVPFNTTPNANSTGVNDISNTVGSDHNFYNTSTTTNVYLVSGFVNIDGISDVQVKAYRNSDSLLLFENKFESSKGTSSNVSFSFYVVLPPNDFFYIVAGSTGGGNGMFSNSQPSLITIAKLAIGEKGDQGIQGLPGSILTLVEGTGITIDDTDPFNPIISATGGGITSITTSTPTTGTGFLKGNGSVISFDNSTYLTSVTPHNLLSSTHGDTLAGTVVRGDIVIGNSTPKWSRLALGTNGQVLTSNGTDIIWATPSGGGGGAALSALTFATASNSIANGVHAQTWNWNLDGTSTNAFTIADLGTSGTGTLFNLSVASSTNVKPFKITIAGTAVLDTGVATSGTANRRGIAIGGVGTTIIGGGIGTGASEAPSSVGGNVFIGGSSGAQTIAIGTLGSKTLQLGTAGSSTTTTLGGSTLGLTASSGITFTALAQATGGANFDFTGDVRGGFGIRLQAPLTAGSLMYLVDGGESATNTSYGIRTLIGAGGTAVGGVSSFAGYFQNEATGAFNYGSMSIASNGGHGTCIGGRFEATGGVNNYALITSGGTVGIGTSTPLSLFAVNGGNSYFGGNAAANSTVHINGSLALKYTPFAGNGSNTYTILATDYLINCTTANCSVLLPTAAGIEGRIYIIKNSGTGTTVTITTTSGQTINGLAASTYNITNSLVPLKVMSNGTNWITLASTESGTVALVNSGTNISVDNTDPNNPIINSLADRYKTTSTTSNTISNGSKTFTVDANLAYIPLQEILIVFDVGNHMHGEVTSYSGTTLIVDVQHHTGSGTYTSWSINLDGTPVDAITGTGTANRLAYFTAAQVIDDLDTATYPSLTELSYVKGVTSAIQTQLDNKQKTITSGTAAPSGGADGDIYLQYV
jgi:hypothetical protein